MALFVILLLLRTLFPLLGLKVIRPAKRFNSDEKINRKINIIDSFPLSEKCADILQVTFGLVL